MLGGGATQSQKNRVVVSARFHKLNPYPINDQNLRFSPPSYGKISLRIFPTHLWPDQKLDTLFMTWPLNGGKLAKINTLHFMIKMAENSFGAAHTYIAHIRESPPPPRAYLVHSM